MIFAYLTSQINQFLFHGYFSHIDILKSEINFKIESENEEYPYIWFTMGIDHSNPYIHNTTVLCDKKMENMAKM